MLIVTPYSSATVITTSTPPCFPPLCEPIARFFVFSPLTVECPEIDWYARIDGIDRNSRADGKSRADRNTRGPLDGNTAWTLRWKHASCTLTTYCAPLDTQHNGLLEDRALTARLPTSSGSVTKDWQVKLEVSKDESLPRALTRGREPP